MPKSKRAKVVHLTKVDKKGKEHREAQFAKIQECLDEYKHCFVFRVENMRGNFLQQIRGELEDCKIIMGKTTIMSKALGTTPETAHAEASHLLSKYLSNPSSPLDTHGLLFTNREAQNLLSYTRNFSATDFARAGTASNRDFIIPAGQVYSTAGEIAREDDVPLVHSMEPELRGLGVPTRLEKGKITLENEYVVCREGQVLDSRQTRLLKMFGVAMAEFRVRVVAYWSSETHEVTEVDDEEDEE